MTLVEANALAGLIRDTGGKQTAQGGVELINRIKITKDKLEKAGYKMVQVKTGELSYTFKAEPI